MEKMKNVVYYNDLSVEQIDALDTFNKMYYYFTRKDERLLERVPDRKNPLIVMPKKQDMDILDRIVIDVTDFDENILEEMGITPEEIVYDRIISNVKEENEENLSFDAKQMMTVIYYDDLTPEQRSSLPDNGGFYKINEIDGEKVVEPLLTMPPLGNRANIVYDVSEVDMDTLEELGLSGLTEEVVFNNNLNQKKSKGKRR